MRKRITITFTKKDYDSLRSHLLKSKREESAILLAGTSETPREISLLIREVIPILDAGFQEKRYTFLKIDPDFFMPIVKRCRYRRLSMILTHSHPFSANTVNFSFVDDGGEKILTPKIQGRAPKGNHGAMVFGTGSVAARVWPKGQRESQPVDLIKVIGEEIEKICPTNAAKSASSTLRETHHRQILAFGEAPQRRILETTVGIVGLGGTGSQVFQQLVRLGVSKLIIIDDDVIEESNLSRIVGSRPSDVGKPKVEVMERFGKEINPNTEIVAINDSVNNLSVALKLREAEVIFGCTDNLTSRIVLNRIVFQYLIPVIDMGVDIQVEKDKIRSAAGRVMVLLPDAPCLECMGYLKPEQIQQEIEAMGKSSYITGVPVRSPSVISLNGVVSSLAVTEFVNLLTGFEWQREPNRYQMYLILNGIVKLYDKKSEKECTLCREVKGLGDSINLPCKLDK